MRKAATIILSFCLILTANAIDRRQEQINDIKKDSTYLYADVTLPTQEQATSQAYEQLQREIISWASEQIGGKTENVSAIDINRMVDTIMTRRADMYRVFAYACKAEILSTFMPQDVVGHASKRDNPCKEDVVGHASKRDTTSTNSTKHVVAGDTIRHLLKESFLGRKGGVIEQIKKARTFFELKDIMEPLKAQGDILDYGKYATAKKPEDCFLIVYDPAGNIRALLGTGKETRWNLKTSKEDSLGNYRGCGAIWFKLRD